MVLVDELTIAQLWVEIGQQETGFMLRRLSQQTKNRACQGHADNQIDKGAQAAPIRRVAEEHRSHENERQQFGDPAARCVRVGANRLPHASAGRQRPIDWSTYRQRLQESETDESQQWPKEVVL